MNNRPIRTDWTESSRAAAVVAEAFSTRRTYLVSAEPGPHRDRFAKECVAAAIGKRVLIFAPDLAAAEPIRSRLVTEIANRNAMAEQDRRAVARSAAERKLADAERELAALRATAHVKPGFFARLFGGNGSSKLIEARISEWEAARATAEAELRRLDGVAWPIGNFPFNRAADSSANGAEMNSTCCSDRNDRILNSTATISDISQETPLPIHHELKTSASMTSAFASPAFDPDTICIATPADLPFSGPSADLAITLAAERITAGEFAAVTAMAPTQIVIGDPSPAVSSHPQREPRTESSSAFFAEQWSNVRPSAWTTEGDRIVCRLEPVSRNERELLKSEPLIDRPDVELRFTSGDNPVLVEVAFAPGGTAAQARAWLAAELDESRPVARGPAEWKTGDRIRAVWFEADAESGEWIESVAGVRELIAGTDADAATAEMQFDPAAGWTRESAEEWLNEKRALTVPPTVELPTFPANELRMEFATAG